MIADVKHTCVLNKGQTLVSFTRVYRVNTEVCRNKSVPYKIKTYPCNVTLNSYKKKLTKQETTQNKKQQKIKNK